MVVEQANNTMITVEATCSHPELEESMARIRRFLVDRLAESAKSPSTDNSPRIVIDVAFLGIPERTEQAPERWENSIVYPIRVHYSHILLGPLYRSWQQGGPCPRCLEQRWLANRSREEQRALQHSAGVLITGPHPGLHAAALESLWSIVEADLSHLTESENGRAWFYVLNLDSLQVQRHQLIRDSLCRVCAQPEPDRPDAETFQLAARPKPDVEAFRLVDPLDYALPEQAYVNPCTGMIAGATQLELFHTVTAPVSGVFFLSGKDRPGINTIGWGGHSTRFHTSRRIGLLEALERYCGHYSRAKSSRIFDSYANLSALALDARACGLYPPETYQASSGGRLEAYHPDSKIAWVWGYSFRHARPILVPEQLAYYYPQSEKIFVEDTSNGCAIGSCLEEAIFHGLLELIERDNFLLHWYAKLAAPRIDPWSSSHLKTLRLADRIERAGYDLYLLDTRLDLPVPTVTAVGVLKNDALGKLVLAAGASFDPHAAICAAISEVAAYMSSMVERVTPHLEDLKAMAQDFTKVRLIEHHTELYGLPEMAHHASFLLQNPVMRSVEETYAAWNSQRPRNTDLRADLIYSIEKVLALGMDVIVVDQTAPELAGTGLKVVRVIVPGLIPIDFGWGRHRVFNLSRLRTVPRTTGHRDTDFDLSMLHLVPHPFP